MNSSCKEIVESDDLFDRVPDEIVRSIFNKLHDAKSLCSSMAVCKRFHSIAPQVDQIYLPIPQKKAAVKEFDKNFFNSVVVKTLMKPLHFISQMIKSKSRNDDDDLDFCSYHVPDELLKPFEEIRGLHLRLPCHGNQKLGFKIGKSSKNLTTFLRWKAEFGRELHSCVMIGAKSRSKKLENEDKHESGRESVVMSEPELKLRIVWTISCLIAASARHYLIQDTVKSQKMIENVVISDESDQGRLCMNKEQIDELKGLKGKGDEVLEYRSRVPALRMKMWYLERLELPDSGEVMEGATLVVIRPAGGGGGEGRSDADLVDAAAFGEEVLGEAARKLMVAKRCYTLEMNSF
ncbi:hypothetical protein BUALT_Bualt02G0179200 [Buddleja alternifolia]|uniref:F-box domain-containing protein n=1 Tax=Buddleja alternifolia TaxID=168488 RepID=A0AAV6Y150_9LAMI|nr:hypothetical protein BUALT_Bualt02G0179200 [Buddleja alternifolia]